MNLKTKLAIAILGNSCIALALGFAIARGSADIPLIAIMFGAALAVVIPAIATSRGIGRSVDKVLGAEPEEIRHTASDLASGYLASWRESSSDQGAAGDLAIATLKLSESFRATREASKTVIIASHRIRRAVWLESRNESEKEMRASEIAEAVNELAVQAEALLAAIDFYSFAPESEADATPIASARKQSTRSIADIEEKRARKRPSRARRPQLVLLPRTETKAAKDRLEGQLNQESKLRLLRPNSKDAGTEE